jgi:hypothetical protein
MSTAVPPRNALIYWSQTPVPASVQTVFDDWRAACPDWDVNLYCRDAAMAFVESHYGSGTARIFSSCRIPAMQSDVFRVLWALERGGVYSDLTWKPKSPPLFHAPEKSLTVGRWHHGRIVNSVFSAIAGSGSLSRVAKQILHDVENRRSGNIWEITGAGAWIKCLGNEGDDDFSAVDQAKLLEDCLMPSYYASSTRGTTEHWSKRQGTEPLYD